MLFLGTTELNIDAKGRLAIPAKYRNRWDPARDGAGWVAVPWPGGVLRLYTEGQFERLTGLLDESLMPSEQQAELDARFFGQAETLSPDAAGRITIPKPHLRRCGLPSEVVLVGARNRLEVRARGEWQSEGDARFAELPELVKRIEARKADG